MHGNAWNHPTAAPLCPCCTHPEGNNGFEAHWNLLCTLPLVGTVSHGHGAILERPESQTFSRPAKADRSLTQSGGTRSRWNAVSAKARKQSQFGGILHNSKSAWSTTSSKPETFCFPLPVLRVAVSAYKMQRVLVLHGEAAPTRHTSRRVVAGCAIATYLVKLYCLPVLDNVVRLHPRVSLDFFIDDSHQSAQGTPREARRLIVAAGRTFTEKAQKHLRVRFADKKTAIVSSH